jgi:hypothetical protein
MDHRLLSVVARGAGPEQGIAYPAFDHIHRGHDNGLSPKMGYTDLIEMKQHRFGQQFGDGVQGCPGHQLDICVGMVGPLTRSLGFNLSDPELNFSAKHHVADHDSHTTAGDPWCQAFGDQDGRLSVGNDFGWGFLSGPRQCTYSDFLLVIPRRFAWKSLIGRGPGGMKSDPGGTGYTNTVSGGHGNRCRIGWYGARVAHDLDDPDFLVIDIHLQPGLEQAFYVSDDVPGLPFHTRHHMYAGDFACLIKIYFALQDTFYLANPTLSVANPGIPLVGLQLQDPLPWKNNYPLISPYRMVDPSILPQPN